MNPLTATISPSLSAELAHRVEAFEQALAAKPAADLAAHLTPTDHPLYLAVLGELIRIDLEHAWGQGRRKHVGDYTTRFPAVLANAGLLGTICFEEYRQRVRAGDDVQPGEYRAKFGVNTASWAELSPESTPELDPEDGFKTAAVPDLNATQNRAVPKVKRAEREQALSDAEKVARLQEVAGSLPGVGTEFVGFHLVEELGRGAFGRVYLARQGDLAGRLVALKVAAGLHAESDTLAQLQHPNIVPIYSYHKAGPFQAVCMPYLGGTTLAQVVQTLSKLPGVPSSGKELRSTLTRGKAQTSTASSAPASGSSLFPQPPSTASSSVVSDGAEPSVSAPSTAEGWARLDCMTFVEAVLALGGQLADGLAHAHRRGILHRDLKPANVLLTDDGRPMLLDFNLAEDTKLRGGAERAMIGGTLPYMAPEQLTAFRSARGLLDGRCDLFGLGVVLFELLTGRHPFPVRKGNPHAIVKQMLDDRAAPPPLRELNPAVSPAVEAIVQKCLAPDPAKRYQSAEELREDIDRQLANRRLRHAPDTSRRERARKWARRHPRLASSATVAVAAAILLVLTAGAGVYARERSRDLEARGHYADHLSRFRDTQSFLDDHTRSSTRLDEGLQKLRAVLTGYGVPEDSDPAEGWQSAPVMRYLSQSDRERVKGDIGETFFLMAQIALLKASAAEDAHERAAQIDLAARWNAQAERYGADRMPRAVREQRAAIAELKGDRAAAEKYRAEADAIPLASARDLYLAGSQQTRQGHHRDALKHLQRATQLDPENFSAWFLRGVSHGALEQHELATMCFSACVSLRPDFAQAWLNRGLAFFHLRLFAEAREDYDQALKLDPNLAEAYIQRAGLREATNDRDGAIEDYTKALATGTATARVYFKRATVKFEKKDFEGAKADRAAGFKAVPTDELSWVARAENRLKFDRDPKAALADVDEALKANPWSVVALQLKSAILAEALGRTPEAIAVLDRAVEFHPDYSAARAGRGVLHARAGNRDAAIRDARDALRRDIRAPNLYQVGCIYALTAKIKPDDKREALNLLWSGLKTGFALDIVDGDTDLDALRNDQDFKDMVKDAKALNKPRGEKR